MADILKMEAPLRSFKQLEEGFNGGERGQEGRVGRQACSASGWVSPEVKAFSGQSSVAQAAGVTSIPIVIKKFHLGR